MAETSEWLKPGAQAVVLQPWDRGHLRADPVTVERVLKRDVVLSNGERFNRSSLEQRTGGAWGMSYYLVPECDTRVAETRRKILQANLRSRAMSAFDDWRKSPSPESARKVSRCFADLGQE